MILILLFKLVFGLISMILKLVPEIDLNFNFSIADSLAFAIQYIDVFVDIKIALLSYSATLLLDHFGFFKKILFMIIDRIPFI